MKLVISPTSKISKIVALKILETVNDNPNAVLGLSTGGTMTPIYKFLGSLYQDYNASFSNVVTLNLDEYIGLDINDKQSYHYYMNKYFTSQVDINPKNVFIPSGVNGENEIQIYNQLIDRYPLDLLILGLGSNGHIGFNEPGCIFQQRTHIQELSNDTRKDNRRFFSSLDSVPSHAITMGVEDILNAKEIIVVATGVRKSMAVWKMFHEQENNACPATVLNRHDNVTLYVDDNAAQLIQVKS